MSRFFLFRVLSGLILLAGLIAALQLCSNVIKKEQQQLRSNTAAHASGIAVQLQSQLLTSVEPLKQLGQWWLTQGRPTDPSDWATDGKLFLSQSPGLREALYVDPQGRQRWSAAPGSTPKLAVVRPDSRVLEMIAAAPRQRMGVSEVFSAPTGAPSVYICFPVEKDRRVHGYVVGLYDASALVGTIAKTVLLPGQRINISADGQQVYGNGPERKGSEDIAAARMGVGERVWTLSLAVPLNYFLEFRGLILSVVAVVGALIYSFAVLLAVSQYWSASLQKVNSKLKSEIELRTRAEGEIRELNVELTRRVADFEMLLNVIPVGIAVANDPECRTLQVNPAFARMVGAAQTGFDLSKLSYRVAHSPRDESAADLPIRASARTRKAIVGEEGCLEYANGSALDVLSFAAPLVDQDGHVRGALQACVDVSERKRLERQMHKIDRMRSLGAMAAGIAHDFNNLLTSMIGHASMATELVPPNGDAMEHIRASLDSAERASGLVQKVLAYTGKSPHILRPVNLGDAIRSAQNWLCGLVAPNARIHFSIAAVIPDVQADIGEVRQVLKNLVLNAKEAAREGACEIEVTVGECRLSGDETHLVSPPHEVKEGRYVRVEVRDHGVGMPADVAGRAFDPFFSTKFVGRGLGLSEVLGIIRSHRGAVRLTTAPESGASVEVFFPVRDSVGSMRI